jgi:3-isopropylmalate dehydrogenase
MKSNSEFSIAVMPGDGIGIEVMAPCLRVLGALQRQVGGFRLDFESLEAGAGLYRRTGEALPEETARRAGAADAILLGAMGLPDIRYPDGREIAPQVDLRERFGLFAGVRPVRIFPGTPTPLAGRRAQGLDLVLIRESTEGIFAGRDDGRIVDDARAEESWQITRSVSEKLFDFAFELARERKSQGHPGKVTCVDKANIFRAFGFFRDIFRERALRYPEIETDFCYVDAAALTLVKQPWVFDVMVTENMFGDILSDLGAGLMGGMGMAPSADIGDEHAVFQPCHGTAPDIAGEGKANPTAMFLSAAMMLDWLGLRHEIPACRLAGRQLKAAVESACGQVHSYEFGGHDGTEKVTEQVLQCLENARE